MQSLEDLLRKAHMLPRRPDGFHALTYNYFISQFASGMVSVLGVVFIFQLGSTFLQGLTYVLSFYGLQRLLVMLILPVSGWLTNRVGYRKTMLIGLLALILRLLFLIMTTPDQWYFLIPAMFFGAVYLPTYYVAFHGLFLDDNDDEHVGEQMGILMMVSRLSMVAAPFVAGVLADRFGFPTMFGVAMFLLMVSLLPLFVMPHHTHKRKTVGFGDVFSIIEHQPRFAGSVFFWYMAQATVVFMWPIYMFQVVHDLEILGSITSVAMIFSSVSIYLSGKIYDKRPLHRLFPIFSMVVGVVWMMRFLVTSPFGIGVADVLGRLTTPSWWMKIRRYELEVGEKLNSVVYGMSHEFILSLGMIVGLLMSYFLLANTDGYWPLLAGPVLFGVFASSYVVRDE